VLLLVSVLLSFCAAGLTGIVNGRLIGRFVIGFDMACSFEQTGTQAPDRHGHPTKALQNQNLGKTEPGFTVTTCGEFGKFCPANPAESGLTGEPHKLAQRRRESALATSMLQRKLE